MPASTENTVSPWEERLLNSVAQGFDAWSGTNPDSTGLVRVRMTPATMARALEYRLSMFTNATEASPQFRLHSSAKRVQIPSQGFGRGFRFGPFNPDEPGRVVLCDLFDDCSQPFGVKTLEIVDHTQLWQGPRKD